MHDRIPGALGVVAGVFLLIIMLITEALHRAGFDGWFVAMVFASLLLLGFWSLAREAAKLNADDEEDNEQE